MRLRWPHYVSGPQGGSPVTAWASRAHAEEAGPYPRISSRQRSFGKGLVRKLRVLVALSYLRRIFSQSPEDGLERHTLRRQ